jgi:hypothetical protein
MRVVGEYGAAATEESGIALARGLLEAAGAEC